MNVSVLRGDAARMVSNKKHRVSPVATQIVKKSCLL
jgi:hypothetical protein